tara:strand:- start:11372 stop:11626 length:255 start_codon:yes stop_codon:yes gene_type:complete
MTVVNLSSINIVAILSKIKSLEESDISDKYSRIIDLLDSTQSIFNVSLDSYKNMELLADHIEFTTTGSVLWQRMRDKYKELLDK